MWFWKLNDVQVFIDEKMVLFAFGVQLPRATRKAKCVTLETLYETGLASQSKSPATALLSCAITAICHETTVIFPCPQSWSTRSADLAYLRLMLLICMSFDMFDPSCALSAYEPADLCSPSLCKCACRETQLTYSGNMNHCRYGNGLWQWIFGLQETSAAHSKLAPDHSPLPLTICCTNNIHMTSTPHTVGRQREACCGHRDWELWHIVEVTLTKVTLKFGSDQMKILERNVLFKNMWSPRMFSSQKIHSKLYDLSFTLNVWMSPWSLYILW